MVLSYINFDDLQLCNIFAVKAYPSEEKIIVNGNYTSVKLPTEVLAPAPVYFSCEYTSPIEICMMVSRKYDPGRLMLVDNGPHQKPLILNTESTSIICTNNSVYLEENRYLLVLEVSGIKIFDDLTIICQEKNLYSHDSHEVDVSGFSNHSLIKWNLVVTSKCFGWNFVDRTQKPLTVVAMKPRFALIIKSILQELCLCCFTQISGIFS